MSLVYLLGDGVDLCTVTRTPTATAFVHRSTATTPPRAGWATLLRRSHHLDVLDCPKCHARLRPIAVVRDKAQARRFLVHLGRPSEPLSLAPARDPTVHFVA